MPDETLQSRSRTLLDSALVALGLSALALTALLVTREFVVPGRADPIPPMPISQWRLLTGEGRWIGPVQAPVVILAFSDFECPACREFARDVRHLQRQHPGMLAVVFRNYPLERYPEARAAATAAECAGRADRFEAYHDALFASRTAVSKRAWTELARNIGLSDSVMFRTCLADSAVDSRNARDIRTAESLGISGTPLLFINGRRFEGRVSKALLAQLIERAARRQQAPGGD
jgi:protein-disulfide isomerase